MTQALSVSLAALMATLAGVVGTQLGRDVVGEIKPIFFSEMPEPQQIYADETREPMRFGAADGPSDAAGAFYWARGPACWGCPGQPERSADPYGDVMDTPIPTAGHAVVRQVREADPAEDGQFEADSRDLRRYMDFPITKDEARRSSQVAEEPQRRRQRRLADNLSLKKGDTDGM